MFCKIPPSPKKNTLQEAINQGKSIQSLTGFVPFELTEKGCCSKSNEANVTIYLPVKVVSVLVKGCSISVEVEYIATNKSLITDNRFEITTNAFYNSLEEVKAYEQYTKQVEAYKKAVKPFDYGYSTLTRLRSMFKDALLETTEAIRKEIMEDVGDPEDALSKAKKEWMKPRYQSMMVIKYFPSVLTDQENLVDPDDDGYDGY